jgi:hypothetical protein
MIIYLLHSYFVTLLPDKIYEEVTQMASLSDVIAGPDASGQSRTNWEHEYNE